jgi:hypothetical protein
MLDLAQGAGVSHPGTLAAELKQGPLPLEVALRFGVDIALALRTIHEEGCSHGDVRPELILINDSGALLLPPEGGPQREGTPDDLAAFGALLERMLPEERPSGGAAQAWLDPATRAGRESVLASARQIAQQCRERSAAIDMQKAAVHLRLLAVLANQYGPEPETAAAAARPTDPVEPSANAAPPRAGKAAPPRPPAPEAEPAAVAIARARAAPALGIDPKSFLSDSPAPERNLVPSVEHCPKCGGHYVGQSRPRGWFEAGLRAMGIPIRRCCQCFYRYITVLGIDIEKVARTG